MNAKTDTQWLDTYAKLRAARAKIDAELADIEGNVMKRLEKYDEPFRSKYGNLNLSNRKYWVYSAKVKGLETQVKTAKFAEREDGTAEVDHITTSIRFTRNGR